jgi:hypothetical protein
LARAKLQTVVVDANRGMTRRAQLNNGGDSQGREGAVDAGWHR